MINVRIAWAMFCEWWKNTFSPVEINNTKEMSIVWNREDLR